MALSQVRRSLDCWASTEMVRGGGGSEIGGDHVTVHIEPVADPAEGRDVGLPGTAAAGKVAHGGVGAGRQFHQIRQPIAIRICGARRLQPGQGGITSQPGLVGPRQGLTGDCDQGIDVARKRGESQSGGPIGTPVFQSIRQSDPDHPVNARRQVVGRGDGCFPGASQGRAGGPQQAVLEIWKVFSFSGPASSQ
jgi:hypothetical protein